MSQTKNSIHKIAGASVGASPKSSPSSDRVEWYRRPFYLSLSSGLLLWLALPPCGFWPLAWIAPIGWLRLIQVDNLAGRRPYLAIWFACLLHWLATMQGVRLAHPVLHIGWIALSCYLALYMTLFVGLTRGAVHRLRVPLIVAAPVIWTGLELMRSNFLTGFAMVLLGHSQARCPIVIQIANVTGAYGVGFLLMFVAACLAEMVRPTNEHGKFQFWPLVPMSLGLLLVLGYGWISLSGTVENSASQGVADKRDLKVILVQESVDTIFEYNPERNAATFEKYRQLTLEACRQHPDVQLVVWPESILSANLPAFFYDEAKVPDAYRDIISSRVLAFKSKTQRLLGELQHATGADKRDATDRIAMLSGCDAVEIVDWSTDPPGSKVFNSAFFVDGAGSIQGRYAKMHLVMFGEYIPLTEYFPWLYRLTPMPSGVTPGTRAECFEWSGFRIMPNVCFESTVPHLCRQQFNELARQRRAPDLLVNVTNDGWFWGSSILDLHLACTIFRAVELQRHVLIAANTGITAAIDCHGNILQELPRRQPGTIVLRLELPQNLPTSFYARGGDWFAGLCLVATVAMAFGSWWRGRKRLVL